MNVATADPLRGVREDAVSMLECLSARQTEVLELKSGRPTPSNKEIGRRVSDGPISASMVEKHLTRAKEKMGAESIDDAVIEFILARALVGDPTWGPGDLELGEAVIQKLARSLPTGVRPEFYTSDEFKSFVRDLRSDGPKAWDARYGRLWRLLPVILIAMSALVLAGSSLVLANALDARHAEQPS